MFGIDMEPNRVEDRLERILIRNCTLVGNVGGGIMFGLHHMSDWGVTPLHPASITIEECTIDGSGRVTFHNGHHTFQGTGPVSGFGVLLSAGGYAPDPTHPALQRLGARGKIIIRNTSVSNTLLQGETLLPTIILICFVW
jgi:hypothetical protein